MLKRNRNSSIVKNAPRQQWTAERGVPNLEEDIDDTSSSNDGEVFGKQHDYQSPDEEFEAPEEKRKRLSKQYLRNATDLAENNENTDYTDCVDSKISDNLRKDRLLSQGEYFRNLSNWDSARFSRRELGGERHSFTSVALTQDEKFILSGSKSGEVSQWDTEAGKRLHSLRTSDENVGRRSEIWSTAVSSDGRYWASGGQDGSVRIYDFRTKRGEVHCFKGHRDVVTCMSFQNNSSSLFTGSLDRCIKHWDVDNMNYLDTLYGHQVRMFLFIIHKEISEFHNSTLICPL